METPDGQAFTVSAGDEIEITATGSIDFGRGYVGPKGAEDYHDATMDSPFFNHVGGLEMWIGDKNSNRYFIGSHFKERVRESGVMYLRVIESLYGYTDGNKGAFLVSVQKHSR